MAQCPKVLSSHKDVRDCPTEEAGCKSEGKDDVSVPQEQPSTNEARELLDKNDHFLTPQWDDYEVSSTTGSQGIP